MVRAAALIVVLLTIGCTKGPSEFENRVRSEMRDPLSVVFSDVATTETVACGFVNGKNGYGGYAGKVPFFYEHNEGAGIVRILEKPVEGDSAMVWSKCPEPARTKISGWITDYAIGALKAAQ